MNVGETVLGWPPSIPEMSATLPHYFLKLYVAGMTARSERAIANATLVCETLLADRYHLDVIDIYQDPAAAQEHQVVAAPTLVRVWPTPLRRLIGDLSDRDRLLAGLDLSQPGVR